MQDFRKLQAWQKSHALTVELYKCTVDFPKEEIYGLTSQIRRAGISVAANIAEGCCRNGKAEFARFLHMAAGSASELEYLLLLSHEIELLKTSVFERLSAEIVEVKRMLTALIRKLKSEH